MELLQGRLGRDLAFVLNWVACDSEFIEGVTSCFADEVDIGSKPLGYRLADLRAEVKFEDGAGFCG